MRIKFIGTGSGKASLKRHHSAFILSESNYHLLVDAGDGISKALLQQNISFSSFNGILITHLHPDHYSGLAELIVQMKISKRTGDLDIFIHESLIEVVKKFIFSSYIFEVRMEFEIKYFTFKHDVKFNVNENIAFTAKQNSHLDDYRMYDTKNELSFVCSSFLFESSARKIYYTGDIGKKDDLYLFFETKIDLMICEITHVFFEDILSAVQKLEPGKLCLTHISDDDEQLLSSINKRADAELRKILITAYDGLTIDV